MISRCEETLRSGGWDSYACTYKAKMQHEGKGYCGVHYPVRVAARRAEASRKWKAEFDAKMKRGDERQHKLDTYDGLLAACELAIENETCVCEGEEGGCLHCIITAAVKAAKPPSPAGVGT